MGYERSSPPQWTRRGSATSACFWLRETPREAAMRFGVCPLTRGVGLLARRFPSGRFPFLFFFCMLNDPAPKAGDPGAGPGPLLATFLRKWESSWFGRRVVMKEHKPFARREYGPFDSPPEGRTVANQQNRPAHLHHNANEINGDGSGNPVDADVGLGSFRRRLRSCPRGASRKKTGRLSEGGRKFPRHSRLVTWTLRRLALLKLPSA